MHMKSFEQYNHSALTPVVSDLKKRRELHEQLEPLINAWSDMINSADRIDPALYQMYDVKRGLRDRDGKGVLTGLTEISEIYAYKLNEAGDPLEDADGGRIPDVGRLYYRGVNVEDMVESFTAENRFGFEEAVYLLLFGELPNRDELDVFDEVLSSYRQLPKNFTRDVIMKAPSKDIMNALARSILTLYSYDTRADDTSMENVLRQSLQLIARFPVLSVYAYQAYRHYYFDDSLVIHAPKPEYCTAENILHLLRPDGHFTPLEAKILDIALVLHAEHGGGNNSTFTTHVVTSSGTDTYSAIAAALGSLKGPKHGGANIKVVQMFDSIKRDVKDWKDDDEIAAYLLKLLRKEAFDRSGLIYGMGHAVYSLSDPRAKVLGRCVRGLSEEKNMMDEYELYTRVEKLAPKVISRERRIYKGVSANVDFYSGFIYHMLDLPSELYTPLFAIARIAGWSAHRMEELRNGGKIIRPAYRAVKARREYVKIDER